MKVPSRFLKIYLVGLLAAFVCCFAPVQASGRVLIVGTCPGASFTQIQAAINATAPGDTVRVCAGTYNEQLMIKQALHLEGDPGAILAPAPVLQNTNALSTGDPLAVAILVTGTQGVTLSGLTVDGIGNGITQCSPRLEGIYYQNASGTIRRDVVRNFKLSTDLNGCQSGTGIFVESGNGGTSVVEIEGTVIKDYQKNGITANEPGTTATIQRNVVTGLGPTTGAAQNGVQIGFGAAGAIRENLVANNIWAPCTNASACQTVATDILVEQSNGVVVADNAAALTQVGIFVRGDGAILHDNKVISISVFDGIRLIGNDATIRGNRVVDCDESGIFIQGNDNAVDNNTIADSPIGIFKVSGSTGNQIKNNTFINVPDKVQDPPVRPLSQLIQPER